MDHIPQAASSPHGPLSVPYVPSVKFAPLAVFSPPWDHLSQESYYALLKENLGFDYFSPVFDSDDWPAFLQASGFFALLHLTFRVIGSETLYKPEDFIQEEQMEDGIRQSITTERLMPLLRQWALEVGKLSQDIRQEKFSLLQEHFQWISSFLSHVSSFFPPDSSEAAVSTSETSQSVSYWSSRVFPALSSIHLSVTILRDTIDHAARVVLHNISPGQFSGPPIHPSVTSRFSAAGWCPRDLYLLKRQWVIGAELETPALWFASSLDRRGLGLDHSTCSAADCSYERIDNETYQTAHTPECDGCEDVVLEDESWGADGAVTEMVNAGVTPTVVFTQNEAGELQTAISAGELVVPREQNENNWENAYDISGPWDPETRELDETEMKVYVRGPQRPPAGIQKGPYWRDVLRNGSKVPTKPRYVAISHVWSHGLGNPRRNALPTCQALRLQRMVDKMVSDRFPKPFPFWIDTLCVPVHGPGRKQAIKNMRNVYANCLIVLVVDATLTSVPADSITKDEIAMRVFASPWNRRLWTFQEGVLPPDVLFRFADRAVHLMEVWIEFGIITRGNPEAHKLQSWAGKSQGILERTRDLGERLAYVSGRNFASQYMKGASKSQMLSVFSSELLKRVTTKQPDEAVCLAALLDLDIAAILAVQDEKQRMKKLFSMLNEVSPYVLFCCRPTYEEPGFRWIPKSLLADPFAYDIHPDTRERSSGIVTPRGLQVTFPGFSFQLPHTYTTRKKLHAKEDLILGIDGGVAFMISPKERSDGFPTSVLLGEIGFLVSSGMFEAFVRKPNTGGYAMPSVPAVLVSINEWNKEIAYCQFEALVYLFPVPELREQRKADIVEGTQYSLPAGQEWCVG